jgi:hypothetical protein
MQGCFPDFRRFFVNCYDLVYQQLETEIRPEFL